MQTQAQENAGTSANDVLLANWQEPRWYVLFVRTNQEKRVAQNLKCNDVEHFLPCYSSMRQWKDRRVKLEMPLFPGYVFVKLPLIERIKALKVPNVISLVGAGSSYAEISEEEIAWIQRGVESGTALPHPHLAIGQRVMIKSGVMAGMEGVLLQMKNSARVVVSLDSINRAFVVEIDGACLEPLRGAVRIALA